MTTINEYYLKFTEDEYWLIYENSYPKDANMLNHRSTSPYSILLLLIAVPLIFMYFADPAQYARPIAMLLLAGAAVAGILFYKAYILLKEIRKISIYYEFIKNGVKITLNEGSMIFFINNRTTIYPISECIQVIIEDLYMEFRFVSATSVLIPKGAFSRSDWERIEHDLVTLSDRVWDREKAAAASEA